jgi:hypothetical protein
MRVKGNERRVSAKPDSKRRNEGKDEKINSQRRRFNGGLIATRETSVKCCRQTKQINASDGNEIQTSLVAGNGNEFEGRKQRRKDPEKMGEVWGRNE